MYTRVAAGGGVKKEGFCEGIFFCKKKEFRRKEGKEGKGGICQKTVLQQTFLSRNHRYSRHVDFFDIFVAWKGKYRISKCQFFKQFDSTWLFLEHSTRKETNNFC